MNTLDFGARNYDPALGRWMNLDPLAEDPRQISRTPYNYGWNSPIYYNDPDGNCPQCLTGAVVGALLEVINQVGSSMLLDGLSVEESFDALEYDKVLLEAGTGALGGLIDGGASRIAKFLSKKKNRELFARVTGILLEGTLDAVNTVARNYMDGNEDLFTVEDLADILIDAGFGEMVDDLFPDISIKKDKKEIKKQKKKEAKAKSKKKKREAKKKKREAKKRKKANERKNKRNQLTKDGIDFIDGISIESDKEKD